MAKMIAGDSDSIYIRSRVRYATILLSLLPLLPLLLPFC